MDLSYSSDQQLLKDSAERFVQNDYPFEARRKLVASEDGFSRKNWTVFADLGWLMMPFAEADGGLGGSPVETMILMEAFGAGLVVEPYLATVVLGGGAIAEGGSAAQKAALLPAIGEGKLQLALAYAEETSRFNPARVETTARKDGGGYVLDGVKIAVLNGQSADKLVVSARSKGAVGDEGGLTLFLVDRAAPGVSVRAYTTVDGLRAADITFAGVAVANDAVVGAVDGGLELLQKVIDLGVAAVCAEAVGAMTALNDLTLDYLKTRQQFGVPIGSFQVLQHRMADMYMACEEARSMTLMASIKVSEADARERSRAQSAAKIQIGRAGRLIGQEAVQMHGGIGVTDELSVAHYFKRLTMIDTLFGDVSYHMRRFGALDA